MIRGVFLGAVLLLASPAEADVDVAGLGGWSEPGAFGMIQLGYSPQGFWAVGASSRLDANGLSAPTVNLRLSLDLLRLVPRFQLGFGYAEAPIWSVDGGLDYFLARTLSLRSQTGYSNQIGWNLAAGIAWYPFD